MDAEALAAFQRELMPSAEKMFSSVELASNNLSIITFIDDHDYLSTVANIISVDGRKLRQLITFFV